MATPRSQPQQTHICLQEAHITELSTHISNQSKFNSRIEQIIEKLVDASNANKEETKDLFHKLDTDLTSISILLTELAKAHKDNTNNQAAISEDVGSIKSQILRLEHSQADTKKDLDNIKTAITEQDKDTEVWQGNISERLTKLEKLSFWVYAVGAIIVGSIVSLNTIIDIYCKLNGNGGN
jgi:uncharacterized coiled-coil protein SlyX